MDKKLTLLFIDDEPNILTALKRALHKTRDQWHVLFAEGGAAAMDILARESVDLIVTDMRMPEMNGLELLKQIAREYPQVIRFVLSGQSDEDIIMESVNYAHQYLAKPFKLDVLMKTVERVQNLRTPLKNKYLIKFITGKKSLQSLPEVYLEISAEISTDSPDPKRIGAIIEEDQSLSANVLKYVNSSFFGLRKDIRNAQQAAIYLGIDTISSLVLSEKLFSPGTTASERDIARIREFKVHSLMVSILAKKVAGFFNLSQECIKTTITGGIMHDIGKLILLFFENSLENIEQIRQDEHLPLLDAELQVVGTTHADIGAYLLGIWGLPSAVTDLIAFHHQPSLSQDQQVGVLTCIHLANAFVNFMHEEEHTGPHYDRVYLERIGIQEELVELESLMKEAYKEIKHET